MTKRRILITEVHNFGGFFGGDTVTLSAVPWPDGEETTLTIDEKALQNITDRYWFAPEMVLDLELAGERVDQAWVVAARDWDTIKQVIRSAPAGARLTAPQMRAYRCATCDLWVLARQSGDDHLQCLLCDQPLRAAASSDVPAALGT